MELSHDPTLKKFIFFFEEDDAPYKGVAYMYLFGHFISVFILFCTLGLGCLYSYYFHTCAMLFWIVLCTYNAANYYISEFSKEYTKEVDEAKKKELAQTRK